VTDWDAGVSAGMGYVCMGTCTVRGNNYLKPSPLSCLETRPVFTFKPIISTGFHPGQFTLWPRREICFFGLRLRGNAAPVTIPVDWKMNRIPKK
jgi:hypothetical protein